MLEAIGALEKYDPLAIGALEKYDPLATGRLEKYDPLEGSRLEEYEPLGAAGTLLMYEPLDDMSTALLDAGTENEELTE